MKLKEKIRLFSTRALYINLYLLIKFFFLKEIKHKVSKSRPQTQTSWFWSQTGGSRSIGLGPPRFGVGIGLRHSGLDYPTLISEGDSGRDDGTGSGVKPYEGSILFG